MNAITHASWFWPVAVMAAGALVTILKRPVFLQPFAPPAFAVGLLVLLATF